MTHNIKEITEVVQDLNSELFDQDCPEFIEYTIKSNGFESQIVFLGNIIWSSEADDREWIEEKQDYESLEGYLKRESRELITRLYKLNLYGNINIEENSGSTEGV